MVSEVAVPLSIRDSVGEAEAIVVVAGELDAGGRERFEQALRVAEDHGCARLVIDLRALAFMDSSGVSCVLRARQRAASSPRQVRVLADPGSQPAHLFELCGLGALLHREGPEPQA